jgi:PPOX class probable F420-dependent enzyme
LVLVFAGILIAEARHHGLDAPCYFGNPQAVCLAPNDTGKMDQDALDFIARHRAAHLATADIEGQPSVVPICYVVDRENIYSAIDQKPKSVPAGSLKRLRNIEKNPRVSLVVDDYSEDWNKLAYCQVTGTASILWPDGNSGVEHARAVAMLRDKYSQYLRMAIETTPMVKISPLRIKMWRFQKQPAK